MKNLKVISLLVSCLFFVFSQSTSAGLMGLSAEGKPLEETMDSIHSSENQIKNAYLGEEFQTLLCEGREDVCVRPFLLKEVLDPVLDYSLSVNKEALSRFDLTKLEGDAVFRGERISLADFFREYDNYNVFEIADWLVASGSITESDLEAIYLDAFQNHLFDNITCLLPYYQNAVRILGDAVIELCGFAAHDLTRSATSYLSDHFEIFYDSSEVSSSIVPEIADIYEDVRTFFSGLGFRYPILETGRSTYRVFLHPEPGLHGRAAFTQPTSPATDWSAASWIEMFYVSSVDSKFAEVVAHEYFHAIQFAYTLETCWFTEAAANWASIIYDGDSEFPNESIIAFINDDTPLSDTNGYGACLFPLVMHKLCGGSNIIKSFYEEYTLLPTGYSIGKFVSVIDTITVPLGKSFKLLLREMHGYNYFAASWYNDVNVPSCTQFWVNNDITQITLSGGIGRQRILLTNQIIDHLSRAYYHFQIPNNKRYRVEFSISFSGGDGYAAHSKANINHVVTLGMLNNVSGSTNWQFDDLGGVLTNGGIILTNAHTSDPCTATIDVEFIPIEETYTFLLSSRIFEKRLYLQQGETAELSIQFADSGRKLFQTFGPKNTIIALFSTSGAPLNNSSSDDDQGYNLNAFSYYDCGQNETVVVKVSFYSATQSGYLKLLVTNGEYNSTQNTGVMNWQTMVQIVHDNLYLYSWANRYKSHQLRYHPTSSGTVRISLFSLFDNYLYIVDPSSDGWTTLEDDNSGGGTNAMIEASLTSDHDYIIIYCQHNPSTEFTDLNTGDDCILHFQKL